MTELLEVAGDVVLPAMRAVFRDGEVSRVELSLSDDSVELLLVAKDETFRDQVVQADVRHMTLREWSERLRSNLADFVAESRFGWGENRDAR